MMTPVISGRFTWYNHGSQNKLSENRLIFEIIDSYHLLFGKE